MFLVGTDPVEVGLVTSLAQPGGNLTGITILNVELLAKCLELMIFWMPPETKTAVLLNPANTLQIKFERQTLKAAERTLAVRPLIFNASNPREIDVAFDAIVEAGVRALVVSGEVFLLDPVRSVGRAGGAPPDTDHLRLRRVHRSRRSYELRHR